MEAARQAVEAFLARNGLHDTTVHETVAPAVTHEVVTKREFQVCIYSGTATDMIIGTDQ